MSRVLATLRQVDWARLAEWVVLAGVLAIAALISYTHLREVWHIVAAPWAWIGPLTVDGLFAAAWLRMRRRRRQNQKVGLLAYATLVGALLVTVAGNVAAAFPAWVLEHRNYVAPVVYAWAAIAFAFVWELVTGHDRQGGAPAGAELANASEPATGLQSQPDIASEVAEVAGLVAVAPAPGAALASTEQKVAHLVHVKGYGRPRIARELDVKDHVAKDLLAAHRDGCQECQEATG